MLLTATVARFLLNEEFGLSTASSHHDLYSLPLGAASAAWAVHQLVAEEFNQAAVHERCSVHRVSHRWVCKPKCFWSLVVTLRAYNPRWWLVYSLKCIGEFMEPPLRRLILSPGNIGATRG